MEFSYRLTGTGWAEARLGTTRSSATITASYLGDALGGLLEAVGSLLEGADEARCCWHEEPGEFRWIFRRTDSQVHLRVLGFGERSSEQPDAQGTLVFETLEPLRTLASAIAGGAQSVLDVYGEEGYLDRWLRFRFPSGRLERVRARLALD